MVRLPSLHFQLSLRPPDLDLEVPAPSGSQKDPFPLGAERTEVSGYRREHEDRSMDGPTVVMPPIPDLPPSLWDDLHADAPRARDEEVVPSLHSRGDTLRAPAMGDSGDAEPPPPAFPAEPVTLARFPSLQFAKIAPPPALPSDAARTLLPESAYLRGAGTIEPAPPPTPEIIEGPPSLRFDEVPPPSGSWDHDVTLTSIPIASFPIQAISVWSVPLEEGVDPEIVMLRDPYSERADSYRALRRKLSLGTARVIAVTSAMPKEGKTVCAINLATALAETSPRNVLLVEANIRSPGLAVALKIEPPTCFVEQLRRRRKNPMEPWVVIEQIPRHQGDGPPSSRMSMRGRLHLLAMAPGAQRPPMLDAVSFSEGMQSLKLAGYEYIIVDTPPVMGAMDMSVIGDSVDGVILTSIVKKSTRNALRQAIEQLKPAPVLGVVVLER